MDQSLFKEASRIRMTCLKPDKHSAALRGNLFDASNHDIPKIQTDVNTDQV